VYQSIGRVDPNGAQNIKKYVYVSWRAFFLVIGVESGWLAARSAALEEAIIEVEIIIH